MKKLFRYILLFILLTAFNTPVELNAQVKNSVYSMFGVGQLVDNSYGINKSLGGTGIAFKSSAGVNYLNPASYFGIKPNEFNMELGIHGIYSISRNSKNSQDDGDVNFSYFSANSYLNDWWVISFGIVPFSFINYAVNSSDNIFGEPTSFEKYYSGEGGLRQIYLGSSFKLAKGLAVGCNTSLIFGSIKQNEFAVSSNNFAGYQLTNQRDLNTFYMDFGMQYSFSRRDWEYTIGLIYGPPKRFNSTSNFEFTYDEVTSSFEQTSNTVIKIPQKTGIGIAAKKGRYFRIGADYEWKNWSAINFSNPNLTTRNSSRLSAGVEYTPGRRSIWWKNLYYRGGLKFKKSYLQIEDTQINSAGITFGIGIPYRETSTFNISFEYGEQGTLSSGLIKDNYLECYLSFSLSELLALKREDDDHR